MSFTKTKEDFVCEHCGAQVKGNGYTNHCPKCLWSKHVDVDPGDRAASCGGMMRPIALEGATGSGYGIVQKCEKCGFTRRQSAASNDDGGSLVALAGERRG